MCINNLSSSSLTAPRHFLRTFTVSVSSTFMLLPSQHPPRWYRSYVSLVPCFRNDIYGTPTGSFRWDRTWASSWICNASIGCGSLWVWYVKRPRRPRLNLGPGRDDELYGGARGCAREPEICTVGNTLEVLSTRKVR